MAIVSRNTKPHHYLSVGDQVEVKSLEEGFLGSWHAGKIIERWKGLRIVEYDHILNDEENGNLVEHVRVSSRVDRFGNCRSRIRPCPPFGEIEREKICYALCVDAYYTDAWWEGVIFDLNGSESRKVFFPDLGDEMEMEIKDLRMTHDWDQLTGHWKPRGKWLFLEVIEEHWGYNLIPSSIKQMWYDVRERLDGTVDWACPTIKPLWKNLVDDIIYNHISLTVDALMSTHEFSKDVLEDQQQIVLHESAHIVEPSFVYSKAVASSEDIDPQNDDLVTENEECEPMVDEKVENNASALDLSNGSSPSCSGSNIRLDKKRTLMIKFVADHGSIDAYLLTARPGIEMTRNVRKYLYHLGWKHFKVKVARQFRIRYKSPDGKIFHDLRSVCNSLKSIAVDSYRNAEDDADKQIVLHESAQIDKPSSVHSKAVASSEDISLQNDDLVTENEECELMIDEKAESNASALGLSNGYSPSCSGSNIRPDKKRTLKIRFVVGSGSIGADPGSVDAYLLAEHPGIEITNNVRNYLYQLGWKSLPRQCGRKVHIRYKSPDGKIFHDLRSACKSLKSIARNSHPNAEDGANKQIVLHESAHIVASSEDIDPQNDDSVTENEECGPMFSPCSTSNIRHDKKRTQKKRFVTDSGSIDAKLGSIDAYTGLIDAYLLTKRPRREMTSKLRKYLYDLGWESFSRNDGGTVRTRYESPDGRRFHELRSACKYLKSIPLNSSGMRSQVPKSNKMSKRLSYPNAEDGAHKQNFRESVCEYLEVMNSCFRSLSRTVELRDKIKAYLSAMGWEIHHITKLNGRVELRYKSPDTSMVYISLLRVCQAIDNGLEPNTMGHSGCEPLLSNADAQHLVSQCSEEDQLHECNRVRNGLENGVNRCSSRKLKSRKLDGLGGTRVYRSRKRVREGCSSSFSQVPRTVLSWMIDNNAISSRKKVYYRNKKDLPSIGEGRITRLGIKCICCNKVFSLSAFAAHVGSNSCQPEENLFLEDERSLLDCQMELISKNSWLMCEEPLKVESACRNQNESWSDHICSICHYGGDLVLCDMCPSAFHRDCLHLPEIPDGDWFCPSCCCGICGGSQFDVNSEQFTDTSILCCEQCEIQYHAHCIRNREMVNLDAHPTDKWFCCKTCEKIHWGLQQLVGKPILVGHDNLTWTVLKPIHYNNSDDFDVVTMARTNSKLHVALGVMHECFEPVKEPQTKREIVEDVILCRRSELKRLNFGGFFTILLERDDELISAALLRVYGDKVAEIPLIGTRFKHRRLGMCRILMNEIEKNLINLGVEKLVLPAAASVLNTWTTAFGFSSLTQSQRSELLRYTFLDFQDTVMCQKPLKKRPSPLSNPVRDKRDVHFEFHQNGDDGIALLDSDGNSGVSEVFQEEQAEWSDCVNQAAQVNDFGDKCSADGDDLGLGSSVPTVTDQPVNKEISTCSTTELSGKKRINTDSENGDRHFLFYKRRKTRDPGSSSAHQVGEVVCR